MVERARAAGVTRLLNAAVSLEASWQGLALAAKYPEVLAAAGVHPCWLPSSDPEIVARELEELALRASLAALGEIGLEYAPRAAPPAIQQAFLHACLELAQRLDLPVCLHVVGAHEDALRLLAERPGVRAVVHYFVGDLALAEQYLSAGCFISVGKPVTRPAHPALRAAVAALPLDRLLLETDSYPLPSRQTEPCHVVEVCRAVAALRGLAPEQVAAATTANFRRFLGHER